MPDQQRTAIAASLGNGIRAGIASLSNGQLQELVIAPYRQLQQEYLAAKGAL